MEFVRAGLHGREFTLGPASADASFRSYWRIAHADRTLIAMDAPPAQEDTRAWLEVGKRLRAVGLHAPEVFVADLDQGFVLMEDLGTRTYLPELDDASADALYTDAFNALLIMQRDADATDLPVFDVTRTIPEMQLLEPWFFDAHLRLPLDNRQREVVERAFRLIADCADQQPRRFMHRDYHSRNLLITEHNSPGIIDFQGAMLGPIAYDLASLLRDCYIAWPSERVDAWIEQYRQRLVAARVVDVDARRFRRWFDLIGLQRHIKVLGIFCRLWYRDGKPGYLADLPRVLDYVLGVARSYSELVDFAMLLERAVAARDIRVPIADSRLPIAG